MKNPLSNLLEKFKKKGASPAITPEGQKKKENFLTKFIKERLGKSSAAKGEDVVGVDLTANEIRLAQISNNKSNQWVLEKFYIHKFDGIPEGSSVLENQDKVADELKVALQKSKISTTNAAIAIPVTSAIIRVVTSPLMTDEELNNAVKTDSLWENLVQLTDNLEDYSIFHQVINRNTKDNTMDILFVASKLADINSYTDIINKSGLNAVIIDVKCFAIKSAVDQINQISGTIEDTNLTAVLEFGLDENYVMILYENNPIITDIFIRGQDRKTLTESNNQEEMDALVRRYITQVKQAIQDFETKYEKRIRNLKVTSNLPNVETYLGSFRKSLVNTGFNLFNPFDGIKIPAQNENELNISNKSFLSTVVGLAFRKLDVFGYYKFVTAVKNINLLPNRDTMIQKKRTKAFSDFAFKGAVAAVGIIYVVLFGFSFWQISSLNKKIADFDDVVKQHEETQVILKKVKNDHAKLNTSLKLSKSLKSNKVINFRVLAQIASSVPKRVRFTNLDYNGSNMVVIKGLAFSDQDILKLINNLNEKKLISQASLASMTLPTSKNAGENSLKGFTITCILGNA